MKEVVREAIRGARAALAHKFQFVEIASGLHDRVRVRVGRLLSSPQGPAASITDEDHRILQLIQSFAQTEALDRDQVAAAAAALWDSIQQQYDGLSNFLAGEVSEQDRYLGGLQAFAARLDQTQPRGREHFFAVTLFEAYIRCCREPRPGDASRMLSREVAMLIDQGRQAERRVA